MGERHVADAEVEFIALNITPDFCIVEGAVVPFDIFQTLAPEQAGYSDRVHARQFKVLTVGSEVSGVIGNAGAGVLTGTSMGGGNVLVVEGSANVHVEGQPVSRHDDAVLMNG